MTFLQLIFYCEVVSSLPFSYFGESVLEAYLESCQLQKQSPEVFLKIKRCKKRVPKNFGVSFLYCCRCHICNFMRKGIQRDSDRGVFLRALRIFKNTFLEVLLLKNWLLLQTSVIELFSRNDLHLLAAVNYFCKMPHHTCLKRTIITILCLTTMYLEIRLNEIFLHILGTKSLFFSEATPQRCCIKKL